MPAIIAAVITALGWAMKFLLARALLALGIQFATFVGVDALIDYALDNALTNLGALEPDVYTIIKLTRIPDAIAVISAAMATRWSLVYGAGKLLMVSR